MPVFTCITNVRDSGHLTQRPAANAEDALREHIGLFPYDDGDGPFDAELEWLLRVSGGREHVELTPCAGCRNVWLWSNGARNEPQYLTYIVRTDIQTES